MADIVNIVNTILANGSTEYVSRVPVATRTNIDQVANPILSYQSIQNEFLNAIVNKIAFTIVQTKIWNNPLAILKKGLKPLGLDIENMYTNPAADASYSESGASLLSVVKPDVKVEYFRLNRQGQYIATIYRNQLRQAFTSWENLGKMIDSITNSLYSGDFIDEFILMKNTISNAVLEQKMITASITAVTDEATAKTMVIAIKNVSSGMTYPGTAYNAYIKAGGTGNAVTTWTPKENQILMIRSDILNYIDVHVLAAAFNMEYAQFMGRIVEVDNFGSMTSINAVLMDEGCLQVWDDMSEMTEFWNAKGLYTNYFWNHWQTYAFSLLANAVAFVTDANAPAAPVITAPGAGDTEVAGTGEIGAEVYITVNGETLHGTVDASADFAIDGFTAMAEGDKVNGYQVDRAGNKSAAATEKTVTS